MSAKSKSRMPPLVVVLVIVVVWAVVLPVPRFLFAPYDALRLAWFAHRIAGTDRIVAKTRRDAVSMTLTGDDAKKAVRAISSASSGRPPSGTDWANIYDVNAQLYKGTQVLGEIEMDGSGLFLIHYHKPPFLEDTGVLHELLYKPLMEAAKEAERKRFESQ